MEKLEEKSNNELVLMAKQMQLDYEAIKMRINKELDKMDIIEADFQKIKEELKKRQAL